MNMSAGHRSHFDAARDCCFPHDVLMGKGGAIRPAYQSDYVTVLALEGATQSGQKDGNHHRPH